MHQRRLQIQVKEHGKRPSVAEIATATTDQTQGRLFVTDQRSKIKFLVDSGSDVSIIPICKFKQRPPVEFNLFAVNGSPIRTFGQHMMSLDLSLQREFPWPFIIADVATPLIGADFLRKYHLAIYMSQNQLVDMSSKKTTKGLPTQMASLGISSVDQTCPIQELLARFPDITRPTPVNEIKHTVQHHITTKGPPCRARARPLDPERRKAAKLCFDQMTSQGIARISKSNWASALVLVKKGNGDWRPAGDYKQVNAMTVDDCYPIPRLHDFAANLSGCTIFSAIDLVKSYHQIPMSEEDIAKTAIITPFGLFEFLRMPFGLKNAPQTFQRFMDSITHDLDFVFVYIDDLLIASKSPAEHRRHLELLFSRFSENGLTINISKCQFLKSELKFLGHLVNQHGFAPLPEKVLAIDCFPKPTTKKQLRRYLGMINFYRTFLKNIAPVLQPLYDMLKSSGKSLTWTEAEEANFNQSKQALSQMTLLNFHQTGAQLSIYTDASDKAVGAVLQQKVNNTWKPLAFFSKALKPQQQKYSALDRELYGIHQALKHFRHYVEGTSIVVFTDHKPLTSPGKLPESKMPNNARDRYLLDISRANVQLKHIAGTSNVVADTLSRFNVDALTVPTPEAAQINSNNLWTLEELQKEQKADSELELLKSSANLKPVQFTPTVRIICDSSKAQNRPYVPASLRKRAFDLYHGLSHPGIKATKKMISPKYYWPSQTKDIHHWVSTCTDCQTSKIHRHTKVSPAQIDMPDKRFSHVHIDLVGPLPTCKDKKYLLTIVDRTTRWPEAIPISDMEAQTVADEFLLNWASRYGIPEMVTSDQGRQFESRLFNEFCRQLGTNRISTSAYNPRANGMVERFHRYMKASLRCLNTDPNWVSHLPLVLLGIRTTVKEDLKCSPAQLVFGANLNLPADIPDTRQSDQPEDVIQFAEQLRDRIQAQQSTPTRVAQSKTSIPKDLLTCDYVLVRVDAQRKPLDRPYQGPYKVLNRNQHTFTIQKNDETEDVNIQRLKPAKVDTQTATFNIPRKRGRPKKSG